MSYMVCKNLWVECVNICYPTSFEWIFYSKNWVIKLMHSHRYTIWYFNIHKIPLKEISNIEIIQKFLNYWWVTDYSDFRPIESLSPWAAMYPSKRPNCAMCKVVLSTSPWCSFSPLRRQPIPNVEQKSWRYNSR